MKKFLTMALALMMILSLFAVPTMAADSVDMVLGGDFDTFYTNSTALKYGEQAMQFSSNGSNTKAWITVTNENAVSGNAAKVEAALVSPLTYDSAATTSLNSPLFDVKAGVTYSASFDVYTYDYGNASQPGLGYVRLALDGSGNGVTWDTANVVVTANGTPVAFTSEGGYSTWWWGMYIPAEQWVNISFTFTVSADKADKDLEITLGKFVATGDTLARTNMGYVDNLSITAATAGATVTEVNDYGTVYQTPHTLVIVPQDGYYVHNLTVGGIDVTDSLVREYSYKAGLPRYFRYIADIASNTAVSVTYGYYTYENMFDGSMEESYAGAATGANAKHLTYELTDDGRLKVYNTADSSDPVNVYLMAPLVLHNAIGDYVVSVDVSTECEYEDVFYGTCYNVWNSIVMNTGAASSYASAAGLTPNQSSYKYYFELFNATAANVAKGGVADFSTNEGTQRISIGFLNATPVNGKATFYFDNFSCKRLVEAGAAPITPVEPPAPTEFDVTITAGANANASVSAATSEGEAVNFTVAPKFGYYIQSITIGGTPFTGFDAYKGGTYTTGAIAADTEIVVTVAELSANTEEGVSTAVATLPAVFAETGEAPVTFGKVLADVATVDEFGIYLTTAEGDEVESAVTKMGPHFKAFYNVGGQYAIEFQGLAAGEYIAKTYVKVAGVTTYGIATTFTVAE